MIQKFLDSCPLGFSIEGSTIDFSVPGFGFGQITFFMENGKMHCNNEYMGKETLKMIIGKMIDECVLEDVREEP